MKRLLLLLTIIFCSTIISNSQVTAVKYTIERDNVTGSHDCKLIIDSGSATTFPQRTQFNSQFVIVVPTGTYFTEIDNFNPLLDNETEMGTVPVEWQLTKSAIAPIEQPESDFYAFEPDLSETSSYNSLNPDDIVSLFRVFVELDCNLDIRPLDNSIDATIIGAEDYSNGFMIGGTDQTYMGNEFPSSYESDIVIIEGEYISCPGECVSIALNVFCAPLGLTYLWETGETTESITVCPDMTQVYDVTVNAPQGITTEQIVTVYVEENTIGFDNVDFFCIGQSYFPYSEYEGDWSSSDPSIASFDNNELLIHAEGTTIISITSETAGCVTEMEITTSPLPIVSFEGPSTICGATSTTMSSSGIGSWISANPIIASVTNAGVVTAISTGTTFLTFTSNETLCSATTDIPLTVLPAPFIQNTDTEVLCIGETTLMASANDGVWESSSPAIATIDNSGLVTAVSAGVAYFTFTEIVNGCTNSIGPILVNPSPEITSGASKICVGETTNLLPITGGTWISTDPTVATINNNGLATGVSPGVARFYFTGTATGCTSDPSLPTIVESCMVNPVLECSQAEVICDIDVLNGYTGLVNSIDWIAFVAPEGVYNMVVSPFNCQGMSQLSGSQINIYTSCESQESLLFDITCNEMSAIIGSDILTPGEDYFLAINSCFGSVCEYEIEFFGDYISQCEGPCDDITNDTVWDYAPAGEFNGKYNIVTYSTAPNLLVVGGRDHLVFYDYNDGNVFLKENNGNGFLDTEILLFNNEDHYENGTYKIYLEDIDNDGLTDLVLSESGIFNSADIGDRLSVYQNLGNGEFVLRFNEQVCEMEGPGKLTIADFDNDGMKDIFFVCVDYLYDVFWITTWDLAVLSNFNSQNFCNYYTGDFNDDGNIDIGFNDQKALINNGDRTFSDETLVAYETECSSLTYFVEESNVILDPYFATFILDPLSLSSEFCSDHYFGDNENEIFRANITSPDVESIIIPQVEGFHFVDPTQECNFSIQGTQIPSVAARKNTKIDLTLNGCTDFLVIEGDQIFAWINPKQSTKILGTAFIDENENGIYDSNELPLRNVHVSIAPGDFSVLTDNDGNYIFSVPPGIYTITANVNEGEWIESELTINNIQISEPCNEGYNFGFVPNSGPEEMATVSMVNTIARCDFETRFTITVENTGVEPLDAVLVFNFDDQTTFFSSDIADYQLAGQTVTANIGPLAPFSPQTYKVTVKMPSGSSNLPMLAFDAKLYDKFGELIEEYGYSDQLRCSYDPNDKREYPDREGVENLTLMDEDIEYTIRFQNNGNDTAFLVKIVDPLDPNIDPSTIRVMNASHTVETCIEGTDLVFLFEDILLVDSTTNYSASQGFVTFRCNAKDGRAEMTPVRNQANIIFDTNAPIITNQTINTLVSVLCTNKETLIEASICDGETFEGHMVSGTYTESFDLPFGCDSVVTIVLDVQGITVAQNSVEICEGETIFFNGINYDLSESIEIVDTIFNENGCIKEVLSLQVNVTQIDYSQEDITVCEGETIIFNGIIYDISESTEIVDTLFNENGCIKEVISLQVDVTQIIYSQEDITACEGDEIVINGNTYMFIETTEVIDSFYDENGCITDIQTFQLMVLPTLSEQFDTTICEGFDYEGLTVAGIYTIDSFDLATGCQLEYTINLEVLPMSDPLCTVGTENLDANLVKLYPNPASESIFIETGDVWESIKIVDTQGKIITTVPQLKLGKLEVSVSQYLSGVYVIIFENKKSNLVKRFIVR